MIQKKILLHDLVLDVTTAEMKTAIIALNLYYSVRDGPMRPSASFMHTCENREVNLPLVRRDFINHISKGEINMITIISLAYLNDHRHFRRVLWSSGRGLPQLLLTFYTGMNAAD